MARTFSPNPKPNPKPFLDGQPPVVLLVGDAALRSAGFRILGRPKTGQATWTRNGRTYTQGQAEVIAGGDH